MPPPHLGENWDQSTLAGIVLNSCFISVILKSTKNMTENNPYFAVKFVERSTFEDSAGIYFIVCIKNIRSCQDST